jgi:hypothetical protein
MTGRGRGWAPRWLRLVRRVVARLGRDLLFVPLASAASVGGTGRRFGRARGARAEATPSINLTARVEPVGGVRAQGSPLPRLAPGLPPTSLALLGEETVWLRVSTTGDGGSCVEWLRVTCFVPPRAKRVWGDTPAPGPARGAVGLQADRAEAIPSINLTTRAEPCRGAPQGSPLPRPPGLPPTSLALLGEETVCSRFLPRRDLAQRRWPGED